MKGMIALANRDGKEAARDAVFYDSESETGMRSQLTDSLLLLIDGGSIIAVVVGVAKAFEWFDGMISDAGRHALGNLLNNAPSGEQLDSWATVFPRLIDHIFGERAISWKFCLRSGAASLIFISIVFVFEGRLYGHLMYFRGWYAWLMIGLASNVAPDYCSLLVSRAVVRAMERRPTTKAIGALLIVDLILGALFGMAGAVLYIIVLGIWSGPLTLGYMGYTPERFFTLRWLFEWDVIVRRFTLGSDIWLRLLFFSSLFTSIWVWLYVLSIGIIKLLHKIRAVWIRLAPYLDIDKKPIVAIGRVAGLLAGAGYAAILGMVWIVRHWH